MKKWVEYSVKNISQIIANGVPDIENQLAVFKKSVSTLVDGLINMVKYSITDIKSDVSKRSQANDTVSALNLAIKRMEDKNFELIKDLSKMFTMEGDKINDVIYQKAQNITDHIQMILVANRKLFLDVAWQHMALCYNISR